MHSRMISRISDLHLLDVSSTPPSVVATKNVSKLGQMSLGPGGGAKLSLVENQRARKTGGEIHIWTKLRII